MPGIFRCSSFSLKIIFGKTMEVRIRKNGEKEALCKRRMQA